MSWNECLYLYHKKHGGQFLAGETDDAVLVLPWKDRFLAVDLFQASGQYGPFPHPQVRVPVTLGKPYKLTVGAEKKSSAGVNAVLKAVPGLSGGAILPADFGFPEVTKKRLIRSDNHPFTKLALGSLDFRNALLACPDDKVEVCPGPGEEGLHLISVVTETILDRPGSDWYVGEYSPSVRAAGEEREQAAREAEEQFFPRMDRFLDLARAAYNAVTQWAM